jgi:hypothetical protein
VKRPEQKAAFSCILFSPTKKVAQTRCGRRRQDRTARSRALPRQFAPVPRGGGQPRPEARNENGAARRTARKETGSSALQQARTRAREEKRKQKGREDWRRGEGRTAPAGECRGGEDGLGGGDRSPAAAGAPHRRCSGRGGEKRDVGWVGGARVRGFSSFCIVAEGWEGMGGESGP